MKVNSVSICIPKPSRNSDHICRVIKSFIHLTGAMLLNNIILNILSRINLLITKSRNRLITNKIKK